MVRVRQESRRRGAGSALLAAARVRARTLGYESMWGRVHEADAESLAFAPRAGSRRSRATSLSGSRSPGATARWRRASSSCGEEHMHGAYEVAAECLPEMALPQHAEAPPFEQWLETRRTAEGGLVRGARRRRRRGVRATSPRHGGAGSARERPHRRAEEPPAPRRRHRAEAGADRVGAAERLPGDRHVDGRRQRGDARGQRRLGYERAPERLPAFIVVRGPAQ